MKKEIFILPFVLSFLFAWNMALTGAPPANPSIKIPAKSLAILEAMQDVFRAVSENVIPSVVKINTTEQNWGSGIIVRKIGKTYYVLTNSHVTKQKTELSITLWDGREITGKLIGEVEYKDIALVSFESDDPNITVAVLGDSGKVRVGDICFTVGSPLGFDSSVTQGIVSALGRSGDFEEWLNNKNFSEFIQTDAAINHGNSGGPLVNIYGEVIGVNTWIASNSDMNGGVGFSIAINDTKKAIDDLINDGKITNVWVGINILIKYVEEFKAAMGLDGQTGLFVSGVFLGSGAAKAGFQAGDFITGINGKTIRNYEQIVREVGDMRVNEKASFTVIRNGKMQNITITIEEYKDEKDTDAKRWPGFTALPLTDARRKELNLDDSVKGVVVSDVITDSPADVIRLAHHYKGIITAVNGKKAENLREFYDALNISNKTEVWFDVRNANGGVWPTEKYKLK